MNQNNNNINKSAFLSPSFLPGYQRPVTVRTFRESNLNKHYIMQDNIARLGQLYNSLPNEMKDAAKNTVVNAVKSNFKGKVPKPAQRANFGAHGVSPRSSGGNSGYALSPAPHPAPVSLNSGLKPNTYVSDYMYAEEDFCSPLHTTSALIKLPDYSASYLYEYFLNVIAFDIQSKAQSNVGFSLNITSNFTEAKLLTAMNSLVYALQIYYYYHSILVYHSDPSNKNEGMIYLRRNITTANLESLSMLARRLQDTPCPPKILDLIRYMSANFASGDVAGAPIIKIIPVPNSTLPLYDNTIDDALDSLNTDDNNVIFSLLRRAVPNWVPSTLPDVPLHPVFDKNFLTIFANCPGVLHDAGAIFPAVEDDTTDIAYCSYTNELDGLAFSLCSIYDAVNKVWLPGLLTPVYGTSATYGHTRRSFYKVGDTSNMVSATDELDFIVRARQEVYTVSSANDAYLTLHTHLFGTNMCRGVSITSLRESCIKSMDYLMSLDTIRNQFPSIKGKPEGGRRR